MDKLDLAEIRARLQSAAEADGQAQRKARRDPFAGLLRSRAATPAAAAPQAARARRVGVKSDDAGGELLLAEPLADAPLAPPPRRHAFGQRKERAAASNYRPLQLPAPEMVIEDEIAAALHNRVARRPRFEPVAETPYHPEDLDDHGPGDTERLYAQAGLEPEAPPAPRLTLRPTPADIEPAPADVELLLHLERVFMAEHAAIEARRLDL